MRIPHAGAGARIPGLALLPGSLLLLPILAAPGGAQVPTFAQVSGHQVGERVTLHHQIIRYLERLNETSPRVRVVRLGESWEGRELRLAIVTSPRNQGRLDRIRETAQLLADPRRTSPADVEALIRKQPVVLWIQGSIHGSELSGTEGMLLLLEHLTTQNDEATLRALENTVVLLEPLVNPDGRDAFAHHNHQRISRSPNAARDDWSNVLTPWEAMMFRTGHYFFDNNRDWTAQTQRETRARARAILEWRPQALIDAHEWIPDLEFFFPHMWGAGRPLGGVAAYAERWCDRFGAAFARTFDAEGRPFTTREIYGCGLPSWIPTGANLWAAWMGAVGILFEQGSSRGLALTRADGSVRTLRYAAENQYLGSWTLVEQASGDRKRMLREYYESHRSFMMEETAGGIRRYLIPPGGDPNLRAEAVNLLLRNGVEVGTLTEGVRLRDVVDAEGRPVGQRSFSAGTQVVEVVQPRVVGLLFDLANTETLPYLFNLDAYGTRDGRALPVRPVQEPLPAPTDPVEPFFERASVATVRGEGGNRLDEWRCASSGAVGVRSDLTRAGYAYLIDGRQAVGLATAYRLRALGYRVAVSTSTLQVGGRAHVSGTVVVRVAENDESVHDAVRDLARCYHLEVRAENSGLGDPGFPALGSASLLEMRMPMIALVAEDPVEAYSFGWAWFTLERQYGIPVTVLRASFLAGTPLHHFNVLVLPNLSVSAFADLLGPAGIDRIRSWVRDGGTLVTLGAATELAQSHLELIGIRSWDEIEEGEGLNPTSVSEVFVPATLSRPPYDPGARIPVDWLATGYEGERIHVLVASRRLYLPTNDLVVRGGHVAATYGELSLERRAAGGEWVRSVERIAGGVYAYHERVGRGRVVAFAEDPNFRAQARGTNRLFLNAVLLSPSAR